MLVIFLEMAGAVIKDESASCLCNFAAEAQPIVGCKTAGQAQNRLTADCSARRCGNGKAAETICTTAAAKPQINGVRENEVKNSALINPCNH